MDRMNKEEIERERVECVFRLGGGKLDRDHWPGVSRYWYGDVPEYAAELKDADKITCVMCGGCGPERDDCAACDGYGHHTHEIRTACYEDVPYGVGDAPKGWEILAEFSSSGEAECDACGDGTGNEDERDACPLCEGAGYIYIGHAAEVVYRALEPS